jgi:RNA polymerase sigma factor (sigma-70 family)
MTDSQQLLAEYVQSGSEAAFHELVTRYLDLVYSAAFRLVAGDAHRAEDVAQMVFVDLSRHAKTLSNEVMLGGWLHRHTCFVAAKTMRGERRRLSRERQSVEMNALLEQNEKSFSQMAPILDEAINELPEKDRQAILLRFFEQHDFRKIGEVMGANEDAARMRVNRALEKLESLLKRRGVASTAAALALMLPATAVQAAPAGLAATISTTTALAGSPFTTATLTKTIAMTTLQKAIIGTTLAVAIGAGLFQTRQVSQLRSEVRTLQQRQSPLTEQIRRLQQERDDATNRLASLAVAVSKTTGNSAELLKLRSQMTRLQTDANQANDPFVQKALKWKANKEKLMQILKDKPEQWVPEMQLLNDEAWLGIAQYEDMDTPEGIRKALSQARHVAKNTFAPILQQALKSFVESNNDMLPTSMSDLKPYFDKPVDDAMLDQYKLIQTGKMSDVRGNYVVTDKQVVDPDNDSAWSVGPHAYGPDSMASETAKITASMETLKPALDAYAAANNGSTPKAIGQLKQYINTLAQQSAYEKLVAAGMTIGQSK